MKIDVTTDKLKHLGITPNEYVFLMATRLRDKYINEDSPIDLDKLIELRYYVNKTTTDFFMKLLNPEVGLVNEWFEDWWDKYPDFYEGRPIRIDKEECRKWFILKVKSEDMYNRLLKCIEAEVYEYSKQGHGYRFITNTKKYLRNELWKNWVDRIGIKQEDELGMLSKQL